MSEVFGDVLYIGVAAVFAAVATFLIIFIIKLLVFKP